MSFWKSLFASVLGSFIAMAITAVIGFVVLIGIIAASVSSDSPSGHKHASHAGTILTLKLSGTLPEYSNASMSLFNDGKKSNKTIREYLGSLDESKSDKNIAGIWLQLSDYSGPWVQAKELRDKLAEVKAAGKFVYATTRPEGCTEKEYYIASIADSIILNPMASLELNGLSAQLTFFKPAMDRLGIKAETIQCGKYKSAIEAFTRNDASPENISIVQEIVDTLFNDFKNTISQSRKVSVETLNDLCNNRLYVHAYEAQSMKLIDAVMHDDELDALLMKRTGSKSEKDVRKINIEDYAVKELNDSGGEESDKSSDESIALVYAVGEIINGKSGYNANPLFGGGSTLGSETFSETMKKVREDNDIKAVVLRIESPGGDAVASDVMWRQVKLTADKKPVIVSMGSVAASGGYFIAAPASRIFAEERTLTGSIGVFGLVMSAEQFFKDKLGVNTQSIMSNPEADIHSWLHEKTPLQKRVLQESADSTYLIFKSVVATGRKMSADNVENVAQGRVWMGAQAKAVGLVDEIGGLNDALKYAATQAKLKSYSLEIFPKKRTFFEAFSDMFGNTMQSISSTREAFPEYMALIRMLKNNNGVQARTLPIEVQ